MRNVLMRSRPPTCKHTKELGSEREKGKFLAELMAGCHAGTIGRVWGTERE